MGKDDREKERVKVGWGWAGMASKEKEILEIYH